MAAPLTEEQKDYYLNNNNDIEQFLSGTDDGSGGTKPSMIVRNADGSLTQEAKDAAEDHYQTFGLSELGDINNTYRQGIAPPTPTPTPPKVTNISYGGSTSGPTQEQMIEAFQKAQDTSGLMSAIGTGTAGVDTPATGLYRPLEGLQSQVGQQATDTQAATGLFQPLGTIQSQIGQASVPGTTDDEAVAPTGLYAGQEGIMSNIGQAGTASQEASGLYGGQSNILGNQGTITANQAAIGTGVSGLQQNVGQAAGLEADGVTSTAPTGLYAGQAGLLTGQQQIGRNITGELGGFGADLASFRTAAEAYQRGAESARGDIQGTQRAGQSAIEQQIGGVGLASNRAAEMLTQQRQAEALASRQRASQQPDPIQQQAQSFAQTAGRNLATPSAQQQVIGPMGPQSQDPRDIFIQNLFKTSQGLMNKTPV
tara:strand:- start:628 stop:1902 length:1275 start_codon:yes stop_codon:yes gene_type:complete